MGFKNVGSILSTNEFNDYVTLMRYNFILTENININKSLIEGEYANYQFDLSDATIVDNGVLINDITLATEIKVSLVNPTFSHSNYNLKFRVMSIEDYNIYNENRQSMISYETYEVTLNQNDDEVILDLSEFDNNQILLFTVDVEIKHNIPRVI